MTVLKFNTHIGRRIILSVAWLFAVAASTPAFSQLITSEQTEAIHAGDFVVPINQSQVLRVDKPFSDLLVGNPDIADVLALTDRSIYILGKSAGKTTLTVRSETELVAVLDLVITPDVEGLKAKLFELMPGEDIEVRAVNGSVVMSGSVSSATKLDNILEVAERFAPDSVTNLLTVAGSQQVMLDVRFVEVTRTALKDLGVNSAAFDPDFPIALITGNNVVGNIATDTITGNIDNTVDLVGPVTGFATGSTSFRLGSLTVSLLFDALEEKGVAKVLAEPNLIAMSGDTANFLAGGEFPIPVAQDTSDSITVEFKEFGISLAFTPTVLDSGLINIIASPEVSRIDRENAVVVSGFEVPGLAVRRATTTVELRDGESFAIAGLITSTFTDTVRQFPGLGDVPILGALYRSTEFQRDETELVIIIEPHLVKPAPAGTLATPADRFVPPSDIDLFLFGRTEGLASGFAPGAGARALSVQSAGGIDGTFGHIIK